MEIKTKEVAKRIEHLQRKIECIKRGNRDENQRN